MTASGPTKPGESHFPVQKIPPSHDYIRQHGTRPKNGRANEQAAPGARTTEVPDPSSPFVHLHVHSNFSFLDGGSRIEELVVRAAELGQRALALTDHDGLYGAVRFAKACGKHGIKPIFGAEVRVESLLTVAGASKDELSVPPQPPAASSRPGRSGHDSEPADDPYHLVLLAENREGYANLCRLISAAHLADPERQHPPLVTIESLRAHAQGLICLTGCRHGEIGYLTDAGRDGQAEAALLRLRDIFGAHHLYVELHYFGYEPHQEAHAGQHGATIFRKTPAIGNRMRHEQVPAPARDIPSAPAPAAPAPPGAEKPAAVHHPVMREYCIATPIAFSGQDGGRFHPISAATPRATAKTAVRADLPQGRPQRLNPSDYDVGFHRDDRPWRLPCLTYCLRLVALARACSLPTVLTVNAHYARETDRAIHLVCRAAGRDKPLSGYPAPVRGVRCLNSASELETLAAPLLELIARPDQPEDTAPRSAILHDDCSATDIALYGAPPSAEGSKWSGDVVQHCCTAIAIADTGAREAMLARDAAVEQVDRAGDLLPSASSPSPLDATAQIAARCTVDLELGTYHFPKVELPRGETAYSLLTKRCFRGIARKYQPVPPRAVELLEKELRMIQQMRFAHYFLVVHDIVRWARAQGVACSGRGSAGNSIVCHALDITASEPIRHNLLFERFLNPNRREMPDIDVDFCSSRRDEVIDHIYKTFGNENVAVVANINTMGPRSAVRIVAEALGYAPTEINALAKHVPHHGDTSRIREYLGGAWPELRDSPLQDSAHAAPATTPAPDGKGGFTPGAPARLEGRYARLLDLVERLDSFPMHLGTHLGGFVITDRPITYYAPLQWAAKGVVVIQFNKDDVAALGLVKMDILGLRTHSAVSETVHLIRQRTGRRIRPYDLPPDDPAAYEIISNGGSIGLFQLESAGQRNLASRLQERDFDDVIAAIALYRPGPLEAEMIGPFIDRRWGIEPVVLPHPDMAEAVADTYGVILYQEQVLRIAQSVAGFDLADADSLRRAMTRDRSREEMAKIGEAFIGGAVARGVPEGAAREVFRQLEGFAAYGFNKSHSVCFAVIAYATAWLKAYYPAEFLCAVLNNYPMGFYTPRTVLNDARRFGLEVRPLDINLSGRGFTLEDAAAPDPWAVARTVTGAEPDLPGRGAAGDVPTAFDPFAQAWTADHDWGLTDADLAELAAEQDGGDLTSVSRVPMACVEALHIHPAPGREAAHAARGDAGRARAPHARGGVEPGACLAPSTGIAPDAARALRVGLSYLKQMGDRSLDRIEEERRHGPFESFEDFYLRTRIDSAVAENLIRVGAFDSLEPDRTELLWRLPLLHDRLEALAGSTGARRGQLRAFSSPPSRAGLERSWTLEDKVRSELELLGLTVSCHPLKLHEEELRRMGVRMSYELPAMGNEVPVTVAGVYERAQNPWMRSGKRTMFLTLEDAYGLFECVCFEKRLAKIAPVVARASYFLVRGRLQNNHKRGLAIVAEEVFDLEEVLARRRAQRAPGAGTAAIPKKVG